MKINDLTTAAFWNQTKMELNISVDCVLFTVMDQKLKVMLNAPFMDMEHSLPGGFVHSDEHTDEAASRILHQRTGIQNIYLNQFKTFSDPGRFSFESLIRHFDQAEVDKLPKLPDRVISIGYFALVDSEQIHPSGGDFQEITTWFNIEVLPSLNFDHKNIITEAIEALRKELHFNPVLHNLLPKKFTMPELQRLYEIILGKKLDRGSFQRKVLRWDIFERLEERRTGVAHKQPFLYRFNAKKYQGALNNGLHFAI
jgi:8-oxo-dGTP diphosphatase